MVLVAMAPGGVALAQQIGDGGAEPTLTPTLLVADGGTPGEAPAAAASTEVTGEQYVVRLRNLEQRINELKEEIFRSKARLSLLAESVLQNAVGGSRAQIVHQNEMGGSYRLATVVYSLDGAPIFNREDDTGALADRREFQVYNGQLGSGDHSLGVNLTYIGAGLPYMRGYRFSVRSTQSFSVPEGKAIRIRVVGFEKGGPLESPESRPAVRYVQQVISLREAAEGAETTPAAPATTGGSGSR
jgi:uncharacterized small protein (DUF1192 family)